MKVAPLTLLVVCLCVAAAYGSKELLQKVKDVAPQLDMLQSLHSRMRSAAYKHDLGASDTDCLLCGLLVNEVQGYLAENMTESEIEKRLNEGLCTKLNAKYTTICDSLVDLLPEIITEIENKKSVSVVCVDHGYCDKPFYEGKDPQDVPEYVVDLDLPAELRWKKICSNSTYKIAMGQVLDGLADIIPDSKTALGDIGKMLNLGYFPSEFAGEIRGCAEELGVDFGWLSLFNIGYEVTDACTSIVAQTNQNKILHVRNMDFWDGIWLTNHLKNLTIQVNYQSKGKTVFHATSFAGYVGVLSGMRPGGFSISIDTRNYPEGISQLFYEVVAAITEKNASLVSFLSRETLTRVTNFENAVSSLSNGTLIADVYYIVGGVSDNQGAVITRNRTQAVDVWRLQAPSRWYEVETNYDHWKQPPWFDNRVDPANNAMNALGRNNLTLDNLFSKVLSVKPVLNLQSTFTMLACPADNVYKSYARNCQYPCAE